MKPTKIIVDVANGTQQVVELTDEEIAEREAQALQAEADRLAQEAEAQRIADLKVSARGKLVAGEPLTAEEAELLVL